jgi:hypothetical protein
METIQECPGSRMMNFSREGQAGEDTAVGGGPSQLRQWPVQMHLVNPVAPYYQNADVLLAADCVAYAHGDFHRSFLKGHSLAIACPPSPLSLPCVDHNKYHVMMWITQISQ